MKNYIAFLRGINVGGKNRLPMKDLVSLLESLGLSPVKTYIQSGNVVFRTTVEEAVSLPGKIADTIEASCGFRPAVLVLSTKDLAKAAGENPFGEGEVLDTTLHLYFLAEKPTAPDVEKMDAIKGEREAYALTGKIFYLYTPDGFGKSKLALRAEKLLGVNATARNWRTVNKVLELARD